MFHSSTIHRRQRCSRLLSPMVKKMCTQQTVMQPFRQNARAAAGMNLADRVPSKTIQSQGDKCYRIPLRGRI